MVNYIEFHDTSPSDIGINQDVRVCDGCFTKRNPDATSNVRFANPIASTYPGASAIPRHDDAAHREEDELQRAIAASLMESQRGEREAVKAKAKAAPVRSSSKQPVSRASGGGEEGEEEDPELAAAIAASLRESERNSNYKAAASSAKTASKSRTSDSAYEPARSSSQAAIAAPIIAAPANPNDLTPAEMENIRLFHALIEKMDADPSGAASRALPGDRDMRMMYEGMASVGGRLVRGIEECVERHRRVIEWVVVVVSMSYDERFTHHLYTHVYQES